MNGRRSRERVVYADCAGMENLFKSKSLPKRLFKAALTFKRE